MKHGFFCTFQSANLKFINYSPIPCFFLLCFISREFANPLCFRKWFLCFDGPYTVFILIYPHWFLFYPFTKSVGFVLFSSPMQHSHIYTVFKHYNEQDAMIEKQKFVQCHHWLVKRGEKKQDEMKKKTSSAVIYNGEGMVEAGIWSEKFLRIRLLEILKETPFFGPSS